MNRTFAFLMVSAALAAAAASCSPRSDGERFSDWYDSHDMARFDRDCVLCDSYGVAGASCPDDMVYSVRDVDGSDMAIEITGTFTGVLSGVPGEYRYRILEHYVLLDETTFHFCPDTVTFMTMSGDVLSVLPPYFWAEEDSEEETP